MFYLFIFFFLFCVIWVLMASLDVSIKMATILAVIGAAACVVVSIYEDQKVDVNKTSYSIVKDYQVLFDKEAVYIFYHGKLFAFSEFKDTSKLLRGESPWVKNEYNRAGDLVNEIITLEPQNTKNSVVSNVEK